MEEVNTDIKKVDFKDWWEGKTGFTIRADDTKENKEVHAAFKEFCRIESDNSYTLGLRKLLEYYQGDFKLEMLHNVQQEQAVSLADLKGSIIELSKKKEATHVEDDNDAF